MTKLVYSAITSLDGYFEDEDGNFGWGAPDPEAFAAINDSERDLARTSTDAECTKRWSTGRRSKRLMTSLAYLGDFAEVWRAAAKVVYSRTLEAASSARTRIERVFDLDAVRQMKETAGHDIAVGGPELAGQAMAAGLVDEIHLFINPLTIGGRQARRFLTSSALISSCL